MKTRLLQYTKGFSAEGLFAPNLAYATETTFTNFVNNAVEGKLGVYDANSGALITAAIATNAEVFVALKRNGFPEILTKVKKDGNFSVVKTVGTAPVNQVVTVVITCGGTNECANCNCCTDETVDYSIVLLDTKSNDFDFSTYSYDLSGKKGKKVKALLDGFRAMINDANNLQNSVRDGVVTTMSVVTEVIGATAADPNTYTFTLTGAGVFLNTNFTVVVKGFCGTVITYTTPAQAGVNALYDMVEQDRELLLRGGWGTEIPGFPFTPEDFGSPTSFTKTGASTLYTTYNITEKRFERSSVIEDHTRYHRQIIGVPTGTALETSLNTIFGV